LVADIYTKISHRPNISVLHLTQNLPDKNKYARKISTNVHYLILCKNLRDAGKFDMLSRQMFPNSWKFAVEGYMDATSVPYGCLHVDASENKYFSWWTAVCECSKMEGGVVKKSIWSSAWIIIDNVWLMLHLNITWTNYVVNKLIIENHYTSSHIVQLYSLHIPVVLCLMLLNTM